MKPQANSLSALTDKQVLSALLPQPPEKRRDSILRQLPDKPFVAPHVAAALVRIFEAVMICIGGFGALAAYPGLLILAEQPLVPTIILLVTAVLPLMLQAAGLYQLPALLRPIAHFPTLMLMWLLVIGGVSVFILLGKFGPEISRGWFLVWAATGALQLIAMRIFVARVLRLFNRLGQFNRRAVLVGGGAPADHVIATLENSRDTGITLVGMFDDRDDTRSPGKLKDVLKLGSIDDLIDFVRSTRIDTLIVTLPVTAEDRLMQIMNRLWVLPVDIRLSAHEQKLRYRPRAYSYIGNLALLDLFDKPLGDWGPFLKSVEDKVIASLALILLSPVLLAVALAVKLDSKGPVFFRQKRYGFNNELIEVYKFRSMFTDQADVDARKLVTRDDPRVTRVGRFIRKSSLDELPQLFNVLKGELSLVGPRPHATKATANGNLYETVVDGYFARHRVKPGMTGWAQVNGWRGETDTADKIERRVEHDLYYIENWSLTFDLYILARTPFALLNTGNAY